MASSVDRRGTHLSFRGWLLEVWPCADDFMGNTNSTWDFFFFLFCMGNMQELEGRPGGMGSKNDQGECMKFPLNK